MIKINSLEIENVKRIKAVQLTPEADGLTIIGGNNNQGKTSVLDAIAWALGGESFRPSEAAREGSVLPPALKITMSNGLVVERKGKNSALKVTDPSGQKAGQQLLDSFVEKLALNLPKFMEASGKEKANILLQTIGINDQLTILEQKEKEIYNERTYVGRTADQKKKYAAEQPYYPDAPEELVSPSELIAQQQEILARNGQREQWKKDYDRILDRIMSVEDQIREYTDRIGQLRSQLEELQEQRQTAEKTPKELEMESTADLEASIANIDEINRKVRANLDQQKAEEDAAEYAKQYAALTEDLEKVRREKTALLEGAKLPLPGLSVSDGELTYKGQKWDNMSGSERLIVSTAIVRRLNPNCGFVLMDKLEQIDLETLHSFGRWLQNEGLQVIATRVSTGNECSIIIEDGFAVDNKEPVASRGWEKGVF